MTRGASGEFDLTARGGDIGGAQDGAAFAWQPLSGNFDLRVRVADLAITDPYAVAGLMARVGQVGNAVFAGTFASSARPGVFFESRGTAGAQRGPMHAEKSYRNFSSPKATSPGRVRVLRTRRPRWQFPASSG